MSSLSTHAHPKDDPGGIAVATAPPTARVIARFEKINYAKRADRVVIRHGRGKVVAIIEIVSPGNKDSRNAIRTFVEKAADILNQGVNLLVVDLFPPTPRDPQGIHKAIWDEFGDEPFEAPPGKPLTVASYIGGDLPTAYVESVGVGDPLPSSPIFLSETRYIPAPLEATYMRAWAVFPCCSKKSSTRRLANVTSWYAGCSGNRTRTKQIHFSNLHFGCGSGFQSSGR